MNTRFLLAVVAASLISGPVYAEQIGVNPQVGLFGGTQLGNDELESGAAVLGTLGLRLNPYFAVDIQGGWMPTTSKEEMLADSDITITSMEFVPKIYAPMGRFQPYIGAGAARFFIDQQLKNPSSGSFITYNQNIDNHWGGVFGGGMDFAVNENMSIGVDVSYLYLRTHVQSEVSLTSSPGSHFTEEKSVNLDALRILAGIRIKFNAPGWTNIY